MGLYRAVAPGQHYVQLRQPVSLADALAIWDKFRPVGSIKNTSPAPYLYSIDPRRGVASAMCAPLPSFLQTTVPAIKGALYRDVR